ncbi:PREDICTED: ultraviolet-B receptor UVR8 isoform X2 [Ipomoea nil]|uniref:ultraviolet-B receptor UVR8 isoform X2 n=1 Tax=Ipomoea nil TaxID=35883 RepID=UPI000900A8CE|nr:PREDICTED: ultraviolet-B receptor UVR8 isoform X2 [Ipomoea nil]
MPMIMKKNVLMLARAVGNTRNNTTIGILKSHGIVGSRLRLWISSAAADGNGKRFAALWGNGDFGRLGHGSIESRWTPDTLQPSAFHNQSLRDIACGGAHTLFLTENGSVYACGLNDFGQLGISDDKSYTTEPVRVAALPKDIIKISAGYHHSCAITVDGELYVWGKNSNGQLGLGKKADKVVSVPRKVESLNGLAIKTASLGFEHSIAVTDNGEALSWGGGGSGRLGHGLHSGISGVLKSNSEYTPRLIKTLDSVKVKEAAAGMLHSACVCDNGCVYTFGQRAKEKFGFGDANYDMVPSMICELPFSETIACGGYHTCVVTSGGELYTWGSNENGCLGTGCTDVTHSPERVQGPLLRDPVSKVSCGWKHTAAISGGNVYTWGWGGSHGTFSEDGHSSGGQLGQGNDVDHIEPTMVNFEIGARALQISCGFNHTGAILEYT